MRINNEICQDIIIKKATNENALAVIDLIFNIWTNEYNFKVIKEDFPDLHDIETYYHSENGLFLVAVLNNKIVGTIACNSLDAQCYVLKRMFISKNYRGLKIAQSLLNELFKQIVFSKSYLSARFYLSTKESEAIAAKNFYLKNGFRIIEKLELPKNFPFFYQDDLFMLKDQW